MSSLLRFAAPPRRFLSPLIAALLIASACGGDDISDDDADATATFATYNAGLAIGFVDLANERAPLTAAAIAELDAEVVCVQEVWLDDQVAALQDAARTGFPDQLFLDPEPAVPTGTEPACPPEEADPLEACARANCGDVPNDQLASCVLGNCGEEYDATSSGCQECLGAAIGGSLDEILETCGSGPGGGFAYGGSFGIGILTRGEILEEDTLVFESTLNRRAVQHARVALPAATVDVFCTHLTAVFDSIPYPRDEGSWAEEQAAQIEAMRRFVDERAGAGGGTILLGDFNTGPAVGELAAEVPGNYEALVAGFANPYLDAADPACTFCADNPLVGGADDDDSVVIDHVLVRDLAGEVVATERILDEPVDIETEAGTVTSAYSDHYGVSATVEFAAD